MSPRRTSVTSLQAARRALAAAAVVVPHTDADGLAAGAIALRARSQRADQALLLPRGMTPFHHTAPMPPGPPAILDWGMRALAGPALVVDHHVPESKPRADQVLVSGFGEDPPVCTSVLMRRIVEDAPPWLAAVGAFGDLGSEGLRLPECAGAPRAPVRRLTALVNAPRRLPSGPVEHALALLVEHDDPVTALADPRVELLESALVEWRAAHRAAMRVAPRVSQGLALVRLESPYQVHPVVAAAWVSRLAPRIVLVANHGYLPGRVNFAVRGGDRDLRTMLRAALPEAEGEFAHGHPGATGGSLDPEQFEVLLTRLGDGSQP